MHPELLTDSQVYDHPFDVVFLVGVINSEQWPKPSNAIQVCHNNETKVVANHYKIIEGLINNVLCIRK